MKKSELKSRVVMIFIISNFIFLIGILIANKMNIGFSDEDLTISMCIILPVFASVSAKFRIFFGFKNNKSESEEEEYFVAPSKVNNFWALIAVFFACVVIVIGIHTYSGITNYIVFLAAANGCFGVVMSAIIGDLFESKN